MQRLVRLAAVAACLACAAAVGVQALDAGDIVTPVLPGTTEGGLYDRSSIWPEREFNPVSLPTPGITSFERAWSGGGDARPGPLATFGEMAKASQALTSGAIVGPRGGVSIYSSQQRADRQIRRLIRRLD